MSDTVPGPGQRFRYLLGRPLPASMQDWVRNDITGPRHNLRYFLRGLVPFVPIAVGLSFIPAPWWVRIGMILLLAIPLLYFQFALKDVFRRHLLRNNGLDPKLADKVRIVRIDEARAQYLAQNRASLDQGPVGSADPPNAPRIIDSGIVEPPADD